MSAWAMFTIGLGVILIQQHAKGSVIDLTFLFTIPLSVGLAALWWSR